MRPVFHYTEKRVRGHVAICVLAAVLEAVMTLDFEARKLTDPDLGPDLPMGRPACQRMKACRHAPGRHRLGSTATPWWVTGEADAHQAYPHAQAMTVDRQMCVCVLAQVISPSSAKREPVCERPDLPRCAETSSGNMMVDGVIPTRRSCGRIVLWRLTETRSRQQSGCWSRPQIIGFAWASRKTSSP